MISMISGSKTLVKVLTNPGEYCSFKMIMYINRLAWLHTFQKSQPFSSVIFPKTDFISSWSISLIPLHPESWRLVFSKGHLVPKKGRKMPGTFLAGP